MKRCLLLALVCLFAPLCYGQTLQNPLQGPIQAASASCAQGAATCVWMKLAPNQGTVAVTITGTFVATLVVEQSSDSGITFATVSTLSSTTTATQFSVAGMTDFRVRASAYTSGNALVFLQSSTAGGSSTPGAAGSSNIQYLSTNCTGLSNCTTVKWDVGYAFLADATTTSGSNIVTCPECKFQTGTVGGITPPAKVGQIFFATDSTSSAAGVNTCLNNPYIQFGGVNETTISSVDSDTQIHVVGNASATSSAKACAAWGDDDTAAINASWISGGCTTSQSMPSGSAFISAPIWQKVAGCTYNGSGPFFGQQVRGANTGSTYIVPRPSFNFASITGGVAGAATACLSCTAAIGNPLIFNYVDFGIFGLGQQVGTLANTALFLAGTAARVVNVGGTGWGGQGGGTTLYGFIFLGDEDLFDQGGAGYFGSITNIVGSLVTLKANFFTGMPVATNGTCLLQNQPNQSLTMIDNSTAGCVVDNGIMTSINSVISGNQIGTPDSACLFMGNGSTFNSLSGDQICRAGRGGEIAVSFFGVTNASLRLSQTVVTTQGAGVDFFEAAGNTITDLGGNTFNTAGAVRGGVLGTWTGTGSITGTAQTSGNIAFTSGWGTSPTATAISGFSKIEQFTITVGTTPGASPVLTVTFPKAFNATPICQMNQVGGTQAIAQWTNGAVSTTSAAFTYPGTPTGGNTIITQLNCDLQ